MLAFIRRHALLRPGDRLGVAVSGGADSVALLRLLLEARSELGIVLAVVHFNHRIRAAEADGDESFAGELARRHELEFYCDSAETIAHAKREKLSLEAAARELRYGYFRRLSAEEGLNRIATAHTLDDQAETVLLRFLRGAGTRGLSGIYPEVVVEGASEGAAGRKPDPPTIIRPLLDTRRQQLREYLSSIGQAWREDTSNLDLKHSRNRVRHNLIPLLEREYNAGLPQVLAEAAEIAREEELFWDAETARLLPQVLAASQAGSQMTFQVGLLRQQPLAVRRRLVRAVAESMGAKLDFHHVEQVLGLILPAGGETRRAELPEGLVAVSRGGRLWLESGGDAGAPAYYEYALPVPGKVRIPQLGLAICACESSDQAYNRDQLLDPARLGGSELRVRNWRAGDRYQPAHSKSPKKLKELLQERRISHPQKALWPVVLAGEQIIWVPGWDIPDEFRLRTPGSGVLLRQEPLPAQEDASPMGVLST